MAVLNDRDQGHVAALAVSRSLQEVTIVTTEEVLTEVLNFFAERGHHPRQVASSFVERILRDRSILVRPQSHQNFAGGLAFYQARLDKGYSLTDCISMQVMRQEGITEILTHDSHFAQEGFAVLL